MKTIVLRKVSVVAIVLLQFYLPNKLFAQQPDSWKEKKPLEVHAPHTRNNAVGFSIGNKGYIGMGKINIYTDLADFWAYVPIANTWEQKADFGGGKRQSAIGFSIDGKGYVGTGYVGDPAYGYAIVYKDFWEYNPQTNKWTQKADFGGGAIGNAIGFSFQHRGYLLRGGDINDLWQYNPSSNGWQKKIEIKSSIVDNFGKVIGMSIGDRGYIGISGGSQINDSTYTNLSDFLEYNPITNKLISKGISDTLLFDRNYFNIDNKGYFEMQIYSGGGYSGDVFFEYETTTNSWKTLPPNSGWPNLHLPWPYMVGGVSFNINGKGYLANGIQEETQYNEFYDFYEFNPKTLTWTNKAGFSGNPRAETKGFSAGGKGYFYFGFDDANFERIQNGNEFWEIDPLTERWKSIKTINKQAGFRTSQFNVDANGYLLVGPRLWFNDDIIDANYRQNHFWAFNPQTQIWTQKAIFPGIARQYAVGFSIGKKGYLGTGRDEFNNPLNDFWEYNTLNNKWTQKASFVGTPRSAAIGFSIDNRGYLGTGFDAIGRKRDFWEYNPISDKWTQKADFGGIARSNAVGFAIGKSGFIGTGSTGIYFDEGGTFTDIIGDFWQYIVELDKWMRRANLPARTSAVGFSIGNKGYIGMGDNPYAYLEPDNYNDLWEYTPPLKNYITTNITGNTFCSNTSLRINYTVSGRYQSGNRFTAQLSDSSGNFTNPTTLGAITSTTNGAINTTIPNGILPGTHYRIRVVASKPAINGFDNGTDISINPLPMVKTRNVTIYLDDNGKASTTARQIDNGSVATCRTIRYSLSKTNFNCTNIGVNTVMLTVTDGNGNKDSATAFVTVKDLDRPGIYTITASPDRLWPADHNMKPITVNYRTWDNCGVTKTWLTASSSDAPSLINNPDIKILDGHKLLLRAERSRPTRNRIYTITIYAQDASGNVETRRVLVEVSGTNTLTLNIDGGIADKSYANEIITGLQVKLIPNPTTNYSTLVFQGNNPLPITIIVTDMMGRTVESKTTIKAGSTVPLGSKYAKGIYFIKVVQGIESQTTKMMKN